MARGRRSRGRRGLVRTAVVVALAGALVGAAEPGPTVGPGVACPADPHLARTAAVLARAPGSVRIALVGDSTRNEAVEPTAGMFQELRAQTRPGGALAGMPAGHIAAFGVSGIRLHDYLVDRAQLRRIRTFRPTLIEMSIGLNDVRVDQDAGPRVAADLVAFVAELHDAVPGADVLLSVPAAIATTDVGAHHYVVGADGAVNPPGAAEQVTRALRTAYLQATRRLDYAGLDDVQRTITGMHADTADPPRFLVDQLHPSARTAARIADEVIGSITGRCPSH